jgi:hypothetical protein
MVIYEHNSKQINVMQFMKCRARNVNIRNIVLCSIVMEIYWQMTGVKIILKYIWVIQVIRMRSRLKWLKIVLNI